MEHEQTTRDAPRGNGHRDAPAIERQGEIGGVVRDAIDHVTVILRDTASIVRLEASQTIDRITRDVGPRAAGVALAATCGFVGGVLLLIAIFLGLGNIIESVAWRLFLYAIVFLGVAIAGAALSRRKRQTLPETFKTEAPPEQLPPPRPERIASPEGHRPLASAIALDQRSR